MNSEYVVYGIAVLSIILGFIALLSQKIYVDATTKQPTEIKLPIIGRLKTNYPALVFVFLGVALAYGVFKITFPPDKEAWTITGRFTPPSGKAVDPIPIESLPSLELTPVDAMTRTIDDQGRFKIRVRIPKGASLEDLFETVEYTNSWGSARIELGKEYKMFLNHDQQSKISNAPKHERVFYDVPITGYQ